MSRDDTTDRINRLEKKTDAMEETQKTFRHEMRTDYTKFKGWVGTEIQVVKDYIRDQTAYERGVKDAELKRQITSGDVVPTQQLIGLAVKAIGVVGTLAAIIAALLGVTNAN